MKPDFSQWSFDELEAELQRRRVERRGSPKPLAEPDWTEVRKLAADTVQEITLHNRRGKDTPKDIYEAAMKAIYGPFYFDWENNFEED